MTRKRRGGFVFVTFVGDHEPQHVHVYRDNRRLGVWDVDHQKPMRGLILDNRLRKALAALGYLREELVNDN
jgi:hypothetical protein